MTFTTDGFTYHGQQIGDDFFPLVAQAAQGEGGQIGDISYGRAVELFGVLFEGDVDPRTFTIETFPEHLVLGGRPTSGPFSETFPRYQFKYAANLIQQLPDGTKSNFIEYFGVAHLTQAPSVDPVPEPATVALVAGGLVVLIRRRVGVSGRTERVATPGRFKIEHAHWTLIPSAMGPITGSIFLLSFIHQ